MFMHRDRQRDDDRAAKDTTPLRGRRGKTAGGVDTLGRAAGPPFGSLLASLLPSAIPATSGSGSRP